jgi:hypothetical protein
MAAPTLQNHHRQHRPWSVDGGPTAPRLCLPCVPYRLSPLRHSLLLAEAGAKSRVSLVPKVFGRFRVPAYASLANIQLIDLLCFFTYRKWISTTI